MEERIEQSKILQLADQIIRYRWLLVGIGVLFVLAMGAGMKKLSLNNDYQVFFEPENPQVLALEEMHNKYSDQIYVFIGIEPKEGDLFNQETLAAVESLVEQLWQTPFSVRIDALTNYQYTRAEDDNIFVTDLIENAVDKTDQEIALIKQIALSDSVLLHRLINPSGTVTGINIALNPPEEPNANIKAATHIRTLLQTFNQQYPTINTYLTGMGMIGISFQESAKSDMTRLVPLMFLVVLVVLWLFMRSLTATIATLLILLFSIIISLGLAGWLNTSLTVISIASITIIMTLAVADCVHILVTLVQDMKKGVSKNKAIKESLRINFTPVLITSLTTVIGFLSLNFSDSPPFKDLGNMVATGMIAAFVYAIFVLPALLSILPIRIKITEDTPTNYTFIPLGRLSNYITTNPKKVLLLSCLPIIGLSILSIRNELSDEFVKYFDYAMPFRTDTEFVSDNLTGIYNVEFSIPSGESGGINNPAYLNQVEAFANWLRAQEEVVHVSAYSDVVKRVNQSMHGDDAEHFSIPTSRSEAAQYLYIFEMSLPFGLDINNQIDIDKAASRLTITLENITSIEVIAFTERAEQWLKKNCPNPAMHALGVSPTLMFAHVTRKQIYGLLYGIATALLFITFVLAITFKSLPYGLLSLIPNILPITAGFGIWAMYHGVINMGTSIVFGMVLGVIVDDTVHFMVKYLQAKRTLKKTSQEAIHFAFATVGQALIVTTVILAMGFLVLGQSHFNINSEMAQLTVIIIFLALVIDFSVLPALLLLVDRSETVQNLE